MSWAYAESIRARRSARPCPTPPPRRAPTSSGATSRAPSPRRSSSATSPTYLRTGQGWLYMATVIDLCTRMVVGLSFSERMTAELPIAALDCAWGRGYVAEGAIFHSDRGSQYTSKAMAEWARAHDVRLSVGCTGSCHDNAVAESFFGTFKNEMYHLRAFATRDAARIASIEYVEGYYNRRRPHSTIDYQIPAEKMDAFFERFEAACEEGVGLPLAA